MRLAGVTYNAALTTMRVRADDLALFSFNGTPHLPEPAFAYVSVESYVNAYAHCSTPSLIGQEVGASDWLTIDQHMIDTFAAVTGDRQWIHVDPERAKIESRTAALSPTVFSRSRSAQPPEPRSRRNRPANSACASTTASIACASRRRYR